MSTNLVERTKHSERMVTFDVGGVLVTDVRFPSLRRCPPHHHQLPSIGIVLEGEQVKTFDFGEFELEPGMAITTPAGAAHRDSYGLGGTRLILIEPDLSRPELQPILDPCRDLFSRVVVVRVERLLEMGRRIVQELENPDPMAIVAVGSQVLEVLLTAAREGNVDRAQQNGLPPWLVEARHYIHTNFRERILIADVARAAGVHPVYLARLFREHFGVPVATYVRELRLNWAANQLATTTIPISEIAFAAGFVDQSHFTRTFRRHQQMTPARYRRMMRHD